MVYCTKCGAPLVDGAKFCTSCGTLVSMMQSLPVQPSQPAEQTQPVFNNPAESAQPAAQSQPVYGQFDEKTQPVYSQPAQSAYDQTANQAQSPFSSYDYQQQNQSYYAPPVANQNAGGYSSADRPNLNISFLEAVSEFFKRYVDFSGRSTKKAYWYVILFNVIVSAAIGILGSIPGLDTLGQILSSLYSLACLIPGIALSIRRMHDTGRSGTSVLINLVPLVGWIIFIVWCCGDSEGDNEWGYAPEFKNQQ